MKTKPTFQRQRLLIALLQSFGGKLTKLDLQKLLFLFTQEYNGKKKAYEFIPYHYGCYSFQANSDIKTLSNYGLLTIHKDDNSIELKNDGYSHISDLKLPEQDMLIEFTKKYKNFSGDKLISYVYNNYAYYTLNSKIAHKYLDKQYTKPQQQALFEDEQQKFYTIGYEGITFEKYINKLIENDIDILCDVRKNPFSMKFGFSKNMLKHALEQIGIKYIHIPELGIESEDRQELNCLEDYKKLFNEYESTTLQSTKAVDALTAISVLVQSNKIALTCFEKDIEYCHRGIIAKKLREEHSLMYTNL